MRRNLNDILFNGYVKEPIPIVIIAITVGIVMLALALSAVTELVFGLDGETYTQEVVFIEYIKDGPIYRLSASNGCVYDLPYESIDSNLLDQLINKNSLCEVEVLQTSGNATYLDVLSLKSVGENIYIPENIISSASTKTLKENTAFMCAICVCYWTFILTSYYFVSNAQRYPRIAAMIIRKNFRNF